MKINNYLLKITLLSLVFTNAFAIGMKGTSDMKEALEQTIIQLEQAVSAYEKGDNNRAVEYLMEAKQIQKSFSTANGKLSMIKSRATQKLGEARSHFNNGDTTGGSAAMKDALAGFKELREKYNAMH